MAKNVAVCFIKIQQFSKKMLACTSINLVTKIFENLRKKFARQIILDQEFFGKSQICDINHLESYSKQKIEIC